MRRKILLTSFNLIRLKPASQGFPNRTSLWTNIIGVSANFYERSEHAYSVFHKDRYHIGMATHITDNVEDLGSYNAGDVVKVLKEYMEITHLEITTNQMTIVGNSLSSGLQRRTPLTMRPKKVYLLSDKIKTRLTKEKAEFLERKKNFNAEMTKMLQSRFKPTERIINSHSSLDKYRTSFKK